MDFKVRLFGHLITRFSCCLVLHQKTVSQFERDSRFVCCCWIQLCCVYLHLHRKVDWACALFYSNTLIIRTVISTNTGPWLLNFKLSQETFSPRFPISFHSMSCVCTTHPILVSSIVQDQRYIQFVCLWALRCTFNKSASLQQQRQLHWHLPTVCCIYHWWLFVAT